MPKRTRSLSPNDALSSSRLKPGEPSRLWIDAYEVTLRRDLAAARQLEAKNEDDPCGGLISCPVTSNGASSIQWIDR